VHPPQLLNNVAHLFSARSQSLAKKFLLPFVEIQEPLYHLSIYEPIRAFAFPTLISEGPPQVKANVAGRVNVILKLGLKRQEQVLVLGRDVSEQVQGAVNLSPC